MSLNQFIDKWLGKKADFDGSYGGQCVDLYRFYVKEVLGFPQSPGVGGAAEIWDSASPKYYDFIKNTPTGVPQKGDIVIWNRRAGGGFGHVAIFVEGDVNGFTSFDQNWPTLDKCTLTKHNYTNVIGWLHPKEIMSADEILVKKSDFENLVHKSTMYDQILAKYDVADTEALYRMISGKDSRITDLGNEVGRYKAEVKNKEEIISRRDADLLVLKTDVNDLMDRLNEAALQIEKLGKEKGSLAIEVEQLKVKIKTLETQPQGITKDSTIQQVFDWFRNLINELLRRN